MNNNENYGAIVKWAGGKSKLAPIIEETILKKTSIHEMDTYVEPFVGGGSFFFYLIQKYEFKNKIISDVNAELINLYKVVQQKPQELINSAEKMQYAYNSLESMEEKSAFFYAIRVAYNESIISESIEIDIEQATQFLFLNKVGFNGLYRVNSKGLYNVPFGKRTKASLFNVENLLGISNLLKGTTILHADYAETIKFANKKALFYFDPPYRPLSTSASFNSYAKSEFNDDSQIKLADFCHQIDQLGAKFALSNSDPKNNNVDDNFFDDLYSTYTINRIHASRMIGASANSRGKVSEILVTN